MSFDDTSCPAIGLHSSQILFHRYQRDYERLLASFNEWTRKREKRVQDLTNQIDTIKQSCDPESKQAKKTLAKLEHQLNILQEEDSEVPDAEVLKTYPHSHRCQRPAYRKLAFENALKESENKKNLAEDVYNRALAARKGPGAKPPSEEPVESLEGAAEDSPPTTPTTNSTAPTAAKKISAIKKIDSFFTRLESGKGMTKTFAPRSEPGTERTYSRWSVRASPFQPNRGHGPPASS